MNEVFLVGFYSFIGLLLFFLGCIICFFIDESKKRCEYCGKSLKEEPSLTKWSTSDGGSLDYPGIPMYDVKVYFHPWCWTLEKKKYRYTDYPRVSTERAQRRKKINEKIEEAKQSYFNKIDKQKGA